MKRFILLLLSCLFLASGSHAYTGGGTSGNPYLITDCNGLQGMKDYELDATVYFELANHIDCRTFGDFVSVGNPAGARYFRGNFDGKYYSIYGLQINAAGTAKGSMFGLLGGTVENVGLVDFNIWNSGLGSAALAYDTSDGAQISNVFVLGGNIANGTTYTSGLVSKLQADSNIVNCYVVDTSIRTENAAYSAGLVALMSSDSNIFHSYSNAFVDGDGRWEGGLVGDADVGLGTTCSDLFWDTQTSGQAADGCDANSTGKTTAQMKQEATFTNWDFGSIWQIEEDVNYPRLLEFFSAIYLNILTIGGEDFSINPDFAYNLDGNVEIGFTVFDLNNTRFTLDLNYSPSVLQGIGTVIAEDLNLASFYCTDQDWDDVPSECIYDWNYSTIADGNYTITGLLKNSIGRTDFDVGDGNFEIFSDLNLTIYVPIDEVTDEAIDTTIYSFIVKILNAGTLTTYPNNTDTNHFLIPFGASITVLIDTNVDAYYWGREYNLLYDESISSDELQPYLAPVGSSVLTTIHTVSATTLTAVPGMEIMVYKDLEDGRTLINDSITDGKGETAVAFVIADNYEIEVWDGDDLLFEEDYVATATTSSHYIYLPVEGIVEFPIIPNVSIRYLPGIREHTSLDVNISVIVESTNESIDAIQIAFYSNGISLLDTGKDELVSVDGNTFTYNAQNLVGFDTEYALDVNVMVWLTDGTTVTSKTDGWWFRYIYLPEDSTTWLLTHGMRNDFGCEFGTVEALGTTCQPLFLIAIFIMFMAIGGLALNQFRNGSALTVLAILFTALFVYITWIPFVWGVLMAVTGVLIIIVKSRIDM